VLTEEGAQFFTQLAAGRAGSEWLLTRDGDQWQKSAQARPMREACARARIVPAVGIHALRHTYASLSVMAEMPLMVLARNLGHADTRMVEMHYGHLRETYVDAAIKASAPRYGLIKPTNVRVLRK